MAEGAEEEEDGKKVLSFGDIVLRGRDVASLRGSNWLNDNVISFYFEWLESRCQRVSVRLLHTSAVQLVSSLPEPDSRGVVQSMGLAASDLVLAAVNDGSGEPFAECEAGSHWSLLALFGNTFFHFDSLPHCPNKRHAVRLAGRLARGMAGEGLVSFKDVGEKAPRQENGNDCGVYVLATAEAIVAALEREPEPRESFLSSLDLEGITPQSVRAMRRRVLDLIHSLASKSLS